MVTSSRKLAVGASALILAAGIGSAVVLVRAAAGQGATGLSAEEAKAFGIVDDILLKQPGGGVIWNQPPT